jgi:hypothetical protein
VTASSGDASSGSDLDRRRLLAILAAAPLAALVASGFDVSVAPAAATSLSPTARRRIAVVGRAYLAAAPDERDATRLAAELGLHGPGALALDRLRRAVQADYEGGRTVSVSGWLLSLTEARAAALVALS